MSSIIVNQILSRNINILEAQTPLFINLKNDVFIQEYINLYPQAELSCYNINFEEYCDYQSNKKVQRFFTAHYQTEKKHDLVIIAFPKSKAELNFTLSMIAHATDENTNIIVVGENKSGIKTLNKVTEKTLINCSKYDSARHCILFVAQLSKSIAPFTLDDWYDYYSVDIAGTQIKVAALPGVFSQNGLDKGTKILLENLPNIKPGDMLDFGCGAGVIASFIGKKHPEVKLNLLDVNALALESSIKTLALNNLTGNVFASNSLSDVKNKYDVVISNPPFHQGITTDYSATERFLEGIKGYLHNNADVIIVANSFLKYEPIMQKTIGRTNRLLSQQGFTIYQCKK
ncbi:methyltransferase [Pseudocolwellia sp. HL-MZ19]|uniref:methyltransferase n=1 Tax=unclassified Pseudocolwellia TaxID=2848178 RepID=UPI003CE850C3